jgi:alkaline phosphatase D
VATPTLVNVTGAAGAANSLTQVVSNPVWTGSATPAGDLILLWATAIAASDTFTCPGFTAVTASTGQNTSAQLLYRVTDGSEGSSFTVTASVTHILNVHAIGISGQASSPFDPSTPTSSGQLLAAVSTTITATGFTTSSNGCLLLWLGMARGPSTPPPTITVPGGFTASSLGQVNTTGTGASSGVVLATATQTTAGATGSPSGTLSASDDGGALLLAIAGASGASGAATLPGTGSVTGAAIQRGGATLSGGGSVSAGQVATQSAALAGTGSLSALPGLALRSAAAVTTGGGSATLAVPAQPVAAGDLIFIWAAIAFPALSFSADAGDSFTAETPNSPGTTQLSSTLFHKIADSGDVAKAAASGSYTITQAGSSHPFSAVIGVVPVTSTAHPFDPSDTPGSGQANTSSTAVTAAGITTGTAGDLLVWLGADRGPSGVTPPTITPPPGYSIPAGVSQATSSGTGTVNTGLVLATAPQGPPGATGSPAGSIGTAEVTGGLLLAIKAAPAVPLPGVVSHLVAGAPTSSSVQAVAKTSGATSCRLAYSTHSDMSSPSFITAQTPDSLGYVRYSVTGLSSATRYYVQVADTPTGGMETLIGTVGACKTLPAAGSPQDFTVALVSCIAEADTTSPAQDTAITDWIGYDADLNIFTGDFDYSGTTSTDTPTQVGVYESQIADVPSLASMVATRWGYYCRSDHEAGPDNGDSDNGYTATNIAAAQQVFPFGTLGDTTNSPVHGLYQAWVVGRIRFIMIDIRNTDRSPGGNTDNGSKTMLGSTQLAWLESQLIQSEPLKVIISDVAWMGTASITNGPDKWWSYDTERQAILSYIAANAALVRNVMLWHGDSHLIGCTPGANNTWGGFPVYCAAPLLNVGGGLDTSTFTSLYTNGGGECRQYGRIAFTDDGTTITSAFQGWDAVAGTAQVSQTDTFSTSTPGTATLGGAGSLSAGGYSAGAATLAGAGSLQVPGVQGAAAALAGTGTLAAPVAQLPGTTLGGAGSVAAAAATQRAGASLAAAGSISGGTAQRSGGTLSATGSLSAAAAGGTFATLAGTGTLAAAAAQAAAATLTGSGSIAASGTSTGATMTAAGSLSALAGQLAGVTLAGAGSITALAAARSSATLAATGLIGTPAALLRPPAVLAGAGSVTGTPMQATAAALAGTASLTGTGTVGGGTVQGAAALAGAGVLAAAAAQRATVLLAGTGSLSALATARAGALLAAAGLLTGTGAVQLPFTVGTLTASDASARLTASDAPLAVITTTTQTTGGPS